MLKTAVYGFLRVSLDLLHAPVWWWGVLLLAVGLLTALFGVVFAAVQTDMKRLLAYSSIENIGLLFAGIGLTLLFAAYGMQPMAALALTAVLYHVASHALRSEEHTSELQSLLRISSAVFCLKKKQNNQTHN